MLHYQSCTSLADDPKIRRLGCTCNRQAHAEAVDMYLEGLALLADVFVLREILHMIGFRTAQVRRYSEDRGPVPFQRWQVERDASAPHGWRWADIPPVFPPLTTYATGTTDWGMS